MAMTPAMESIFANAQQNAASLIETATLAINAKVNTIEDAEAMIQELSSEAVKYNELLTTIMNAMRQVESGDMQKEEAAGIIAPAVKELKDKCTALKIANVEAPGDDITEDEIAILRELIIGAKAAAEDRLVAIRLCDDCKVDPEVENELNPPEEHGDAFDGDVSMESYEDIAEEAVFLASKYLHTAECETAKTLYDNAKKLYSMGSKDKALQYMQKAESMYKSCLKKLLTESGKFEKAERTDTVNKLGSSSAIRHNVTRTDSLTFSIARSKLERKIDRCTAHILEWSNNSNNKNYEEILNQLKADREQAKAAERAAKASESINEMEDSNMENYSEFMLACESMMDDLQMELDGYVATEGILRGEDSIPSKIGAKLRSAASKLKSALKRGDKKAADEAEREYCDAADQLADQAEEEPGKKSYSTAAKIGMVAAGSALAFAGLAAAGKMMKNKAEGKPIVNISGAVDAMKKAVHQAASKLGKIPGMIKSGAGKIAGGVKGMGSNAKYAVTTTGGALKSAGGKVVGGIRGAFSKKNQAEVAGESASVLCEMYGLDEKVVYDTIMEAFDSVDFDDASLASELDALF